MWTKNPQPFGKNARKSQGDFFWLTLYSDGGGLFSNKVIANLLLNTPMCRLPRSANCYFCTFVVNNKLWCESTTNPVPALRIAAWRGFSELTKNVIRSSHGHSPPSLQISCKSVQPFSRNLANKETNKQRYKKIDRKQYPVPRCIGDGVKVLQNTQNVVGSSKSLYG